jgi:hypothetical protein
VRSSYHSTHDFCVSSWTLAALPEAASQAKSLSVSWPRFIHCTYSVRPSTDHFGKAM